MSELPTEKFWMVMGIGKAPPRHQHPSKGAAQTECRRLARSNPGTAFVVLEAVEVVQKREFDVITLKAPVRQSDDDSIPF